MKHAFGCLFSLFVPLVVAPATRPVFAGPFIDDKLQQQ
jgi:hypothetical protein